MKLSPQRPLGASRFYNDDDEEEEEEEEEKKEFSPSFVLILYGRAGRVG